MPNHICKTCNKEQYAMADHPSTKLFCLSCTKKLRRQVIMVRK